MDVLPRRASRRLGSSDCHCSVSQEQTLRYQFPIFYFQQKIFQSQLTWGLLPCQGQLQRHQPGTQSAGCKGRWGITSIERNEMKMYKIYLSFNSDHVIALLIHCLPQHRHEEADKSGVGSCDVLHHYHQTNQGWLRVSEPKRLKIYCIWLYIIAL